MKFTASLFAKTALATSLAVVLLHPEEASACAADPLTGSVCYMVTDFCPQGYLPAQGQILSINAYQALFTLVGNTFGGNQAQGTFGIPDLRGRSAVGVGQGPGLSTITRGQVMGTESIALNTSNLAPHTHVVTKVQPTADNVTIPAVPGTLSVTASLPLSTTIPSSGTAVPAAGTNYLSVISATVPVGAGNQNATFKGPYVQTKPPVGSKLEADVAVTGSPTIPAFSFKVPDVSVGVTGSGAAFSVRDPALGLTACIAAQGIYPQRQ
ncbi:MULTISPECIES: phage tail protein [unclassified Symbiopectobacterium]|uniref:phage tail protein n=1 Tax=unclassified Symbiopectobacterium TaxID=2794573 RepID=UPI002226A12D|nr:MULTISPECIES: tail fiber protein [unclassified Symbiopectobacterium]MCW2475286.1 tail fiber protein [Candidatus Symbiopectobacterium sp. NZEC151]MCW2482651.1 tail fiber protein [Candidatus Symbiopectobacterium sp. NZEC135]MCW2486535.1 tail fiber protein [Candidatus Symbiopectobacterium sp. NZEC127]